MRKDFWQPVYAGEWHEIARLPNTFERGLVAARATYSINPDGSLKVVNEGLKENGKITSIEGSARFTNPQEPGRLKVRFNRFPASLDRLPKVFSETTESVALGF